MRPTPHSRALLLSLILSLVIATALVILRSHPAFGTACWLYSTGQPAKLPLPWVPGCFDGLADPGAQLLHHEHRNWHCTNPSANNPDWGRKFIAFHRQFILDFDIWRATVGADRLEIWDAAPNEPIPGNDEDYASAFTHCFNASGTVDDGSSRPAGALCAGCSSLPADLIGDSNLGAQPSLGDVGARLEFSGTFCWHCDFHNGAGAAGGACDDILTFLGPPHDPAFWMGHKKLDAVARDWQRLQATDIVIVIDRSGSMDDNCPGGTADPGETPCRLNDAKEAAKTFVDMIQDDRPSSADEHMIGLVSFSTNATKHLGAGFVPAAGIVSDDNVDNTPFEMALAGLTASGTTSIGDGLRAAMEILAGGSNDHQAILLLTDGAENADEFIATVRDELGEIQVCAIGFGDLFADDEDQLRSVAEDQGGIFVADAELSNDGVTLQKFFVDCFGQIFDSPVSEDPIAVLPAGQVSTTPILANICGSDGALSFVTGFAWGAQNGACRLRLVVETPAGNRVDESDLFVEEGRGPSWSQIRIPLPYRGEQAGTWTAYGIRPQNVYVNGFTTDAFVDSTAGINLVRREIHRLLAGVSAPIRVLYYEDGSITGRSVYRSALQRELARGTFTSLTTAVSAADFKAKLAQTWELVVFARQMNRTVQVFDPDLQTVICRGQRAILTDFYSPAGGFNPILLCAGAAMTNPNNYNMVIGDGRLAPVAGIQLANPGYTAPYTRTLTPQTAGGPWLVQARNEFQTGSIIGNGTSCSNQTYFTSTLTRGFGRVEPAPIRPRVLLGQRILASFRMTESNRPIGDWDAVTASLTLDRPGAGALETYTLFDNGTNGDRLPGNNYWQREIPLVVTAPGPHVLQARFTLTKGGCTIERQAEYSVVAHRQPEGACTTPICSQRRMARNGDVVNVLTCARTLCVPNDSIRVTITDTKGWLCKVDSTGVPTPIGSAQFTGTATSYEPLCIPEAFPAYVCVPVNAVDGESTIVAYRFDSLGHPNEPDVTCSTTVAVGFSTVAVPPSTEEMERAVQLAPNPFRGSTTLSFLLPSTQRVEIDIFDVSGRRVRHLESGELGPGEHRATWDGRDDGADEVGGGIYFVRFRAGEQEVTKRVIRLQ